MGRMTRDNLVRLLFERLQIVAVDFDRERAFHAAHRLFQIVGNRLREAPDHSRNLFQFAIHGSNQSLFVLVKDRTPLLLRQEIDEEFRIEKACGVGAIVGTPDLVDHLRNFGKRSTGFRGPGPQPARSPSARCWEPASREPRSHLHPSAAGIPTRSLR